MTWTCMLWSLNCIVLNQNKYTNSVLSVCILFVWLVQFVKFNISFCDHIYFTWTVPFVYWNHRIYSSSLIDMIFATVTQWHFSTSYIVISPIAPVNSFPHSLFLVWVSKPPTSYFGQNARTNHQNAARSSCISVKLQPGSLFLPLPFTSSRGENGSLVFLWFWSPDPHSSLLHRSLPQLHPHLFPLLSPSCRESKVQSEAQVPKVILAGRCSKSSAVTGTVVVGAIVRAEGQVGLGYVLQLAWRKYLGGRSSDEMWH